MKRLPPHTVLVAIGRRPQARMSVKIGKPEQRTHETSGLVSRCSKDGHVSGDSERDKDATVPRSIVQWRGCRPVWCQSGIPSQASLRVESALWLVPFATPSILCWRDIEYTIPAMNIAVAALNHLRPQLQYCKDALSRLALIGRSV